MSKLPSFLKALPKDDVYNDFTAHFISWTIHCADKKYEDHFLVNQYSKRMLSKLIFDDENKLDLKKVIDIKVRKPLDCMNLWIELQIENQSQKIALIIEIITHSSIRGSYKENVKDYYSDKSEFDLKFVVLLSLINKHDHERKFRNEPEYSHYDLAQLQELLPNQKTNNDLFDEFWFNR